MSTHTGAGGIINATSARRGLKLRLSGKQAHDEITVVAPVAKDKRT